MFSITKGAGAFLMTLTGLTMLATQASADLQFNASSIVGNIFTYSLNFNNSMNTSSGLPAQRLEAGNFATIYEVGDFTSVALNPAFSSLFTLSTQPFGLTPPGILPGDDTPTNITLTYTGPTTTAEQSFSNILQLNALTTTVNTDGQYSGQTTINTGAAAGLPIGTIGSVAIPGIGGNATPVDTPEPGSMALLVTAGLSGVFAYRRRRLRK